jgi:hypothetical protein
MLKNVAILVIGVLLGCAGVWLLGPARASSPRFDAPFQAVLLDNGQAYFGKVSGLGTPFPIIREVYYIQSVTNPETKQVNNILIRGGNEFHGPEFTVLNARHVVMVEPVGTSSKVAQLIAEQEKKK